MTTWNQITVETSDHGPVTLSCPEWCNGDDHPDGVRREDIEHHGDGTTITVPTPCGPIELFTLGLVQRPFTRRPIGDAVHVNLHVAIADGWVTDPDDFDRLAANMIEAISTARLEVRRLSVETLGGGQ